MTSEFANINRRAIFFVGGFDPKSPQAFYERMDRENGRFETLWNTQVSREPLANDVGDIVCSMFQTTGEDLGQEWSTQTDFHYLSLNDIVLKDFSLPLYKRILRYLVSFGDYVLTASALKFIWHNWRFSLYFFYPMFMLALSVLLGLALALWVGSFDFAYATLAAVTVFGTFLSLCYYYVLKRSFVPHLMDLWSFSSEYLYRRRPDMDEKLDRLADQIFQAASSDAYDEVLTIGHSTGGALILDATARAMERHPEYAVHASKVVVLTVGSTALKIGLHPFAGWYRNRLENLFANSDTRWMEWQCITDVINFHGTDPSKLMGFGDRMQQKINVKSLRVREMVDRAVYMRIKRNYFRVHYQFVYANTQKYIYDFPAICFGPVSLPSRVDGGLNRGIDNPFLQTVSGRVQEKA